MRYRSERRSKARKSFRRSILIERVVSQSDRISHIHQNGTCLDISEDGLGLTAAVSLRRGELVKLFIPASTVRTTVPVFSEVIWARPTNGDFRTGLRFLQ